MEQLNLNDLVTYPKEIYYYFETNISKDYMEFNIYITEDKTKFNMDKLLVRIKNYLYNYKFFHCKRINDHIYIIMFDWAYEVRKLILDMNKRYVDFYSINWKHLAIVICKHLAIAKKIKYQIIEEDLGNVW